MRSLLPLLLIFMAASSSSAASKPLPVVIDTDIGGDIDDAFALGLAVVSPELQIVGITTVGKGDERDPTTPSFPSMTFCSTRRASKRIGRCAGAVRS
jgi:hypothetical protein